MKHKNWIGIAVAAAMAAGSLSAFSVSAENGSFMGDIDNDGYLTGHDTAMLSRYLLDDAYTLTEDQLSRADITGDGLVDEADVTWMHVNEEYALGEYDMDGKQTSDDAFYVMTHIHEQTIDEMTPLQKNLADTDANGVLSYMDTQGVLSFYASSTVGHDKFCGKPFCYYFHYDENFLGTPFVLGDADGDRVLTDHDALLIMKEDTQNITDPYDIMRRDVNFDGKIDQADSDWIHEHAEYAIGELHKDGSLGNCDAAYYALLIYTAQSVGKEIEVVPKTTYDSVLVKDCNRYKISALDFNLLDANADGKIDTADTQLLLTSTAYISVGHSYESAYQDIMLS